LYKMNILRRFKVGFIKTRRQAGISYYLRAHSTQHTAHSTQRRGIENFSVVSVRSVLRFNFKRVVFWRLLYQRVVLS